MFFFFKYLFVAAGLFIIFCVFTFPYVKKALIPNNTPSIWFDKNDPTLASYTQFQQDFGNDRIITLAFKDERGILQPIVLRMLHELIRKLSEIDGIKEVQSVLTAKDFRRIKKNDITRISLSGYFDSTSNFSVSADLKKKILNSPLIVDRYINHKADVTIVIMKLKPFNEVQDQLATIISEIKSVASVYIGEKNVHLGGSDVMSVGLNQMSQRDFWLFSVLGFILMFLLTGLYYRRFIYLILVSITSLSAIYVALAVHGLLGFRINIFSVITPPLIITLGTISILQIIDEYEDQLRNGPQASTVLITRKTINNLFKPAMFASLTTIIGFASLFTSPTAALKEFSIFSSVGVFTLFIFSFLFAAIFCRYKINLSR